VSCYFLEATAFAKLLCRSRVRRTDPADGGRRRQSQADLGLYAAGGLCGCPAAERAGNISAEDAAAALDSLRVEAARMVQQPLNPAVLEASRQLLDRTALRWPDTLQLGAALVARDMFQGTEIISSPHRRSCSSGEG